VVNKRLDEDKANGIITKLKIFVV